MNCRIIYLIENLLITLSLVSAIDEVKLNELKNKFLDTLGIEGVPKVSIKDVMKKSVTKVLLESLNNTDNIVGFTPELNNIELKCEYNILYNMSVSGIDKNQFYKGEFRVYKRRTIGDDYHIIYVSRNFLDRNHQWKSIVIDYKNISSNYEGWMTFNLTKTLRLWLNNENENHGLCLTADSRGNSSAADAGIAGIGNSETEPFVLGYFRNQNTRKSSFTRKKRQMSFTDLISCKVEKWYLNFESVRMKDAIISPPGYYANYCKGSCHAPRFKHYHSMLEMAAHYQYFKSIPLPSCVPKEYSSIDIIYYDKNSKIVKRSFDDMVVDECECR